MMNTIYDDGIAVDKQVRSYMSDHPGVSYRVALTALIAEDAEREQEQRAEFNRRVPAYQSEFKIKSYGEAAELVAKHDADMVGVYGEENGIASIGEVVSAAKKAAGVAKISLADAVRRILSSERDTAKKVAGDWLDHKALTEINNMNLGSSIDAAYPIALRLVTRAYPEVNAMWSSGTVSELAMKTIFIQWFKD